jgi:hypothetical protein
MEKHSNYVTSNQKYGSFYHNYNIGLNQSSSYLSRTSNYSVQDMNVSNIRPHENYNNEYYARQTGTYNPMENRYREQNYNNTYGGQRSILTDSRYKQRSFPKNRISLGLPNLGNTCYM